MFKQSATESSQTMECNFNGYCMNMLKSLPTKYDRLEKKENPKNNPNDPPTEPM